MPTPIELIQYPDPYPYYAKLVSERPFSRDDELASWVAADATSVRAVLSDPRLRVRPPAEPVPAGIVGTPAGDVFGRLVRMTDGDVAARLKRIVVGALQSVDVEAARRLAADRAVKALGDGGSPPFRELMFGVPAQVTAALCGLDEGLDREASRLIGDFVLCIPAGANADQQGLAAVAAGRLQGLLGPRLDAGGSGLLGELVRLAIRDNWTETAPLLANGIGLLSQTYDATAGLIGNTLVALARGLPPRSGGTPIPDAELADIVREVARYDAPIQNTRRFAAEAFSFNGLEVPVGGPVLLLLAAANRDPAANPNPDEFRIDRRQPSVFTFGSGAHHCPGSDLAVAITTGVVGEVLRSGVGPGDLPSEVTYRPSANARIPDLPD